MRVHSFAAACLFLLAMASTATAAKDTNFFTTQALAQQKCLTEPVVWVDLASKTYHRPGPPKAGYGTFMCENDAKAAGYRPAGNAE